MAICFSFFEKADLDEGPPFSRGEMAVGRAPLPFRFKFHGFLAMPAITYLPRLQRSRLRSSWLAGTCMTKQKKSALGTS
jgi:hypothetical protein